MRASSKADIIVIGAGFAGLSTAYHLAKKNDRSILVLEQEDRLGGHASGRNAGMIRRAVSDPVLARLAVEGCEALSRVQETGFGSFGFKPSGSLFLAKGNGVLELKKTKQVLDRGHVRSFFLSKKETARKVSVLADGDYEKALFCPGDANIEIESLLEAFLQSLKKRNVPVLCGHKIESIKHCQDSFEIAAGGRIFYAGKIVNAAGAWAGIIGEMAGALKIPFNAYRRHLFLTAPSKSVDRAWPFVWDLSNEFYFRPKDGRLLVSPCDKKLFRLDLKRKKGMAEKVEAKMRKEVLRKLNAFAPNFGFVRLREGKAGLRTMAPDGRFVIGEDPKVRGFYWVAGLGGHGVTTSFSVGRLAADIISGIEKENFVTKALSPRRFIPSS